MTGKTITLQKPLTIRSVSATPPCPGEGFDSLFTQITQQANHQLLAEKEWTHQRIASGSRVPLCPVEVIRSIQLPNFLPETDFGEISPQESSKQLIMRGLQKTSEGVKEELLSPDSVSSAEQLLFSTDPNFPQLLQVLCRESGVEESLLQTFLKKWHKATLYQERLQEIENSDALSSADKRQSLAAMAAETSAQVMSLAPGESHLFFWQKEPDDRAFTAFMQKTLHSIFPALPWEQLVTTNHLTDALASELTKMLCEELEKIGRQAVPEEFRQMLQKAITFCPWDHLPSLIKEWTPSFIEEQFPDCLRFSLEERFLRESSPEAKEFYNSCKKEGLTTVIARFAQNAGESLKENFSLDSLFQKQLSPIRGIFEKVAKYQGEEEPYSALWLDFHRQQDGNYTLCLYSNQLAGTFGQSGTIVSARYSDLAPDLFQQEFFARLLKYSQSLQATQRDFIQRQDSFLSALIPSLKSHEKGVTVSRFSQQQNWKMLLADAIAQSHTTEKSDPLFDFHLQCKALHTLAQQRQGKSSSSSAWKDPLESRAATLLHQAVGLYEEKRISHETLEQLHQLYLQLKKPQKEHALDCEKETPLILPIGVKTKLQSILARFGLTEEYAAIIQEEAVARFGSDAAGLVETVIAECVAKESDPEHASSSVEKGSASRIRQALSSWSLRLAIKETLTYCDQLLTQHFWFCSWVLLRMALTFSLNPLLLLRSAFSSYLISLIPQTLYRLLPQSWQKRLDLAVHSLKTTLFKTALKTLLSALVLRKDFVEGVKSCAKRWEGALARSSTISYNCTMHNTLPLSRGETVVKKELFSFTNPSTSFSKQKPSPENEKEIKSDPFKPAELIGILRSEIKNDPSTDSLLLVANELPLPVTAEGQKFWDSFPDVAEGMELVFQCCCAFSLPERLNINDWSVPLAYYKGLAILDYLARKCPEAALDGFSLSGYELALLNSSPGFLLLHPSDQMQWEEICSYFRIDPLKHYSLPEVHQLAKNSLFSYRDKVLSPTKEGRISISSSIGFFSSSIIDDTTDSYLKKLCNDEVIQEKLALYQRLLGSTEEKEESTLALKLLAADPGEAQLPMQQLSSSDRKIVDKEINPLFPNPRKSLLPRPVALLRLAALRANRYLFASLHPSSYATHHSDSAQRASQSADKDSFYFPFSQTPQHSLTSLVKDVFFSSASSRFVFSMPLPAIDINKTYPLPSQQQLQKLHTLIATTPFSVPLSLPNHKGKEGFLPLSDFGLSSALSSPSSAKSGATFAAPLYSWVDKIFFNSFLLPPSLDKLQAPFCIDPKTPEDHSDLIIPFSRGRLPYFLQPLLTENTREEEKISKALFSQSNQDSIYTQQLQQLSALIRSESSDQITRTLSFFSDNLHLLSDSNYQTTLFVFLFQGAYLRKELLAHPQSLSLFRQFLTKAFERHWGDLRDTSTALFILDTGLYLFNHCLTVDPSCSWEPLPFRELLLKELLPAVKDSATTKFWIARQLNEYWEIRKEHSPSLSSEEQELQRHDTTLFSKEALSNNNATKELFFSRFFHRDLVSLQHEGKCVLVKKTENLAPAAGKHDAVDYFEKSEKHRLVVAQQSEKEHSLELETPEGVFCLTQLNPAPTFSSFTPSQKTTYWIEKDESAQKSKREVLIVEEGRRVGSFFLFTEQSAEGDHFFYQKQSRILGKSSLAHLEHNLHSLLWFCPEQEIFASTDREQPEQIKEISFSAYPTLTFSIQAAEGDKGIEEGYCSLFPDFFLDRRQNHRALLQQFPRALFLRNAQGKQKILISAELSTAGLLPQLLKPLSGMSHYLDSRIQESLESVLSSQLAAAKNQKLFSYDVDTKGALTSQNSEELLYLLLHYSAKGDWGRADHSLAQLQKVVQKNETLPPEALSLVQRYFLLSYGALSDHFQWRERALKLAASVAQNDLFPTMETAEEKMPLDYWSLASWAALQQLYTAAIEEARGDNLRFLSEQAELAIAEQWISVARTLLHTQLPTDLLSSLAWIPLESVGSLLEMAAISLLFSQPMQKRYLHLSEKHYPKRIQGHRLLASLLKEHLKKKLSHPIQTPLGNSAADSTPSFFQETENLYFSMSEKFSQLLRNNFIDRTTSRKGFVSMVTTSLPENKFSWGALTSQLYHSRLCTEQPFYTDFLSFQPNELSLHFWDYYRLAKAEPPLLIYTQKGESRLPSAEELQQFAQQSIEFQETLALLQTATIKSPYLQFLVSILYTASKHPSIFPSVDSLAQGIQSETTSPSATLSVDSILDGIVHHLYNPIVNSANSSEILSIVSPIFFSYGHTLLTKKLRSFSLKTGQREIFHRLPSITQNILRALGSYYHFSHLGWKTWQHRDLLGKIVKAAVIPAEKIPLPAPVKAKIGWNHPLSPAQSFDLQEQERQIDQQLQTLLFLHFYPVSSAKKSPAPQVEPFAQLSSSQEQLYGHEFEELDHSLEQFYNRKERAHYDWNKEGTNLHSLASTLHTLKNSLEAEIVFCKKSCIERLQQAQREQKLTIEEQVKRSLYPSSAMQPLTWDEIQSLFLQGEEKQWLKLPLSEEELSKIRSRLYGTLLLQSRKQQIDRLLALLEKLHSSEGLDPKERPVLLQQIIQGLQQKRAYSFLEELPEKLVRAFLVFEAKSGRLLWDKQIERLKTLLFSTEERSVLESIMGSGKTAVLIPLLAKLEGDRQRLPILVWPPSIEKSAVNLTGDTAELLDQQLYAFSFSRNTPITPASLRKLYTLLSEAKEQGSQVHLSKSSLQALELRFIELLETLRDQHAISNSLQRAEIAECVERLAEILSFLKSYGSAIIDEAHESFKRKVELNHPISQEKAINNSYLEVIYACMRHLALPEADSIAGVTTGRHTLLSQETYLSQTVPSLARHLSKLPLFALLSLQQKEITAYLIDPQQNAPLWLKDHPHRSAIALARGVLHSLLPESFKHTCGVDFGSSKEHPEIEFAIPYKCNDLPQEDSRFKNSYEALIKTFLLFLQKNLTDEQKFSLLAQAQAVARSEMQISQCDLEMTPTGRLFARCAPHFSLASFDPNSSDISKAVAMLPNHPELSMLYVKMSVAPEIKTYESCIKSDAQNFASMLASFTSLTGTPGNWRSYPQGTTPYWDPGTTGESIDTLQKCAAPTVALLQKQTPRDLLDEILHTHFKHNSPICALIDRAALLTGVSNREVAQRILSHLADREQIDGVVYFEGSSAVVLQKGKEQPISYERCSISCDRLITYFDQAHTFGADIKQKQDGIGLVTVGEQTSLSDLLQAIWRMRGLRTHNQKILLAGKAASLHQTLAIAEPTTRDIITYCTQHEAKQQRLDNFLADQQKMRSVIRRAILDKILEQGSFDQMGSLFTRYRRHLISTEQEELFSLYGMALKPRPAQEIIEEYRAAQIQELSSLALFTQEELAALRQEMEKIHSSLYPIEPIALAAHTSQTVQLSLQTQTQVTQEVQVEVEAEEEAQVAVFPRDTRKARKHIEWEGDSFNPFTSADWTLPSSSNPWKTGLSDLLSFTGVERGQKTQPILSLSDFLFQGAEAPYAALFDKSLLCSANFVNQTDRPITGTSALYQKPLFEVLVVQQENALSIIALDQHDAAVWREKLQKNRTESAEENGDVKIALYDVSLQAFVETGKASPNLEQLQSDKQFLTTLLQLKIFDGRINGFSYKEIELFKEWAEEVGLEKLERLVKEIHKARPRNKTLVSSQIGILLQELNQEERFSS